MSTETKMEVGLFVASMGALVLALSPLF